jgi:hypothetical protein
MELSPMQELARAEDRVGTQAYDILNEEDVPVVPVAEGMVRCEVPATWARVISLPPYAG